MAGNRATKRWLEIAQGGFGRGSEVPFGQHDPNPPSIQFPEGMHSDGVAADAPFRLLGHLDLGDQAAGCRIPSGKLDAGCFTDQTASSVAPDEIFRP